MTTILQDDRFEGATFQSQPKARPRILVVEDDPFIRRLNTEVLGCSGYQVDAAEDGAVAWDLLQLIPYDLMVTDNDMPNVTGVELIKKLQAANLVLPVIMATGNLPEAELNGCNWLQPEVTLLKPYTFDELLTAVKNVLHAAVNAPAEMVPTPSWPGRPTRASRVG